MGKHHLMALLSRVVVVLAIALLAPTSHAWDMPAAISDGMSTSFSGGELPLIHMLRPLLGSAGQLGRHGVPCDSWRVGVEAHNVRDWKTVPKRCEHYVGHYMLGGHYRRDSRVVVDEAVAYAESLKLARNGKEVWVFDIDETSLSNLPYYAKNGFGVEPYNATAFTKWVFEGAAPALPESLRLYKKLLSLGIRPVFLTGRVESQRKITVQNLKKAGYHTWQKLLLKPDGLKASAVAYKSGERRKLQSSGLIIVGNIGDQWSDILGYPEGARTFKLPDPVYYIG